MNIYVETNFVLELTLLQEQHESCEKIVELCETRRANLILPAYCLVEPNETIVRYAKNRTRISDDSATEVKQLSRSKPYLDEIYALQKARKFLIESQETEETRLRSTIERLLDIAEIISLTPEILSASLKHQTDFVFSPQDSIVHASVLKHLKASTNETAKCFLNRNSKDFNNPDVVDSLNDHNCKTLFSFARGYDYVFNQIGS